MADEKMTLYQRLMNLDRRWVFLVLAIFIIFAFIFKVKAPLSISKEVRDVYEFVENLKEGDYILIALDYDPNAMAELHPMAYALLEQAMAKKLKVITLTLSQNGSTMAEKAVRDVADSTRIYHQIAPKYGEDYVFLGYRPYYAIIILMMGQNFRIPFPSDYYNTPLDSIPIMRGVQNYDQVKGVVDIVGGNVADAWLANANGRYHVKLALGMTGVMAADYYPYYQSEQLIGLLGGMKGAAEYEALVHNPGRATEAMGIQVYAHIVIIGFILLGNIGFLVDRSQRRKRGDKV
jgi:hypothetical protein